MLDPEDCHRILDKLIGPTSPMGEHVADGMRLENLKDKIAVVELLLEEIADLVRWSSSHEASVKAIGVEAEAYLDKLRKSLANER